MRDPLFHPTAAVDPEPKVGGEDELGPVSTPSLSRLAQEKIQVHYICVRRIQSDFSILLELGE